MTSGLSPASLIARSAAFARSLAACQLEGRRPINQAGTGDQGFALSSRSPAQA